MVISDWNWASGLRAPWWRDFTAAAANCSGVASRSSICFTHHEALRAMRTDPEGFSRSRCMRIRSTSGTPSSMPAKVSTRSPVHIFSTPTTSTVGEPPRVARVPMWSADDPPAQELSTLITPALRNPACRRNDWPRMHPWSTRRPAVAFPKMTRLTSAGSTSASASASATTWWAMSSIVLSRRFIGMIPVPTMCTWRSMVSSLCSGVDADSGQSCDQAFELIQGFIIGDVENDVLSSGASVGCHSFRHFGGIPGDQMTFEGLGRNAVQTGHPLCSSTATLVDIVIDRDEQHHRAGHTVRFPPGSGGLLGQSLEGARVLRRVEEQGHPAVSRHRRPAQRGLGRPAHPHRDNRGSRKLSVAGGPAAGDITGGDTFAAVPRTAELGDAGIELSAPGVVVDAGLLELSGMATHADTQDEPTAGKLLQRGRLFCHRRGLPEGKLHDAGPEEGPVGCGCGHGQCGHALEYRTMPEQVVARPQGCGSESFGLLADTRKLFDRVIGIQLRPSGSTSRSIGGKRCPLGSCLLGEGRKNEPDRPQFDRWSLHEHAPS